MNVKTDRLEIRPLRETDKEDLYEIYKDKDTCRFLLHEPWNSSNKDDEFKAKMTNLDLREDKAVGLACVLEDKVIGDVTVWYTEMKDTVEIGYVFNREYSEKGYATEALGRVIDYLFNTVKVHRIQANMDARNHASANVCKRIGMRKEAHFIEDYWSKGEWTDSFVFGMLRSDFDRL